MTKILCDGCDEPTLAPHTITCAVSRDNTEVRLTWKFTCCLVCVSRMRLKMPDMWAAEEFNTGAK